MSLTLKQPALYCVECDEYYPFSETQTSCPKCGTSLRKITHIIDATRIAKISVSKPSILLWKISQKCSFCSSEAVVQCIFECTIFDLASLAWTVYKATSFCCNRHVKTCPCWKLCGFIRDNTGEIVNPAEIMNIIENKISPKTIITQGGDVFTKVLLPPSSSEIQEYLKKLETLYRDGKVSEAVYKKLKEEYEAKMKSNKKF